MSWLILILAGLFEVGFTTCMRLSDGFRVVGWSIGFGVCAFLSFWLLNYASRSIPLGTAYAVWVGIGAVGTLLVGTLFFGEAITALRIALVLGIVACVAGLQLTSSTH